MEGGGSVTTKRAEAKPAIVPYGAAPAGSPLSVEEWANRAVGTDRMRDALRTGVRGGKSLRRAWGLFSLGAAQVRWIQSRTGS